MRLLSGASLVVWFLIYCLFFDSLVGFSFTAWGTTFLMSLLSAASLVVGLLI